VPLVAVLALAFVGLSPSKAQAQTIGCSSPTQIGVRNKDDRPSLNNIKLPGHVDTHIVFSPSLNRISPLGAQLAECA